MDKKEFIETLQTWRETERRVKQDYACQAIDCRGDEKEFQKSVLEYERRKSAELAYDRVLDQVRALK